MEGLQLQYEASKKEWKLLFALQLGLEASSANQIWAPPGKTWYKQCDPKPNFLNLSKDIFSPTLYNMTATSPI